MLLMGQRAGNDFRAAATLFSGSGMRTETPPISRRVASYRAVTK